ncbi:MAG: TonB-dependent receptor [Thiobacillus sp.]
MRQITLTLALGVFFSSFAYAESVPEAVGETVIVTATRTPLADVDAPFASEVHTRHMIEQSGATTLYDYLAQHTSLLVLPSYGNKASPKIDMRGYGMGDGYQNIVVSLDGRRLNNIDMSSQLLGAIPLGDIERIEITKGSGSVLFGDGATAGTIQIVTRQHSGASVQVSAGNFGAQNATLAAGLKKERFSISASADYAGFDGASERDVTGHRAASRNTGQQGKLEVSPLDGLTLNLNASRSRIDTRYVGALTLAEYEANPAQNSGNTYTHQKFETDVWGAGLAYALAPSWKLTARHQREDKLSNYITYASKSDYDYRSDDLALEYRGDRLNVTTGVQTFDGTRIGRTNRTTKDNIGWFMQGQYVWGATTVSAGARTEKVEYIYAPNTGTALKADHDLSAWDVGINHRLDKQLSLFANYNQAFQAPDIDRFFNWGGTFNAFISPAISRTVNVGFNHVTPANRLKFAVFYAKLKNEIYYFKQAWPLPSHNTNLDKTHKYGLELQDTWQIAPMLAASINYAYTRALIDREDGGSGAFDGKDLPGVPRHGVNLGLNWRVTPSSSLNLTHTWRAATWAAEDFDNNNTQKQQAYQSTNLAYQYRYKQFDWFAAVDNLFEQSNGIWVRDNAIYPVNFTRNWRVGMKAEF